MKYFFLCLFMLLIPSGNVHALVFRNPDVVCSALEKEGLKLNETWHENGWRDFTCATSYLPLTKDSGVPTNISYYVESEQPDEIMYIRLVLNINDDGAKEAGKKKFLQCISRLFSNLGLQQPEEIIPAFNEEKDITINQDYGSVSLEVLKGATNTFRLVIRNQL